MIGLRSGGPRSNRLFAHSALVAALGSGPRAPSEARHLVAEHLEDVVDAEPLETVKLLVSEAVTNCVEHAPAGDDGSIDVRATLLPAAVRVEVSTPGPGFSPGETASLTDEHGRGLQIVELLSERWGIRAHSNGVWFEVRTASPT